MKIGMIGAQSKHVDFFCKPINKEILFKDVSVDYIWGNDATMEDVIDTAHNAGISNIADSFDEVIKKSDAIMIITRDGSTHKKYALECLKNNKPVFIDKPFTASVDDAVKIIEASHYYNTPFTGGSTLCFLPEIEELRQITKDASNIEISYRADINSPYGGWYFYGSHLTDLYSMLCENTSIYVNTTIICEEVQVSITYTDKKLKHKKVTLYSNPEVKQPAVKTNSTYILNDTDCYTYGLRAFFKMISSNKNINEERLLYSVKLLNAIMKSASSGKGIVIKN